LINQEEVQQLYQTAEKERTSAILRGFHYRTNLDTLRLARDISYSTWKPTNYQPNLQWLHSLKNSLDLWLNKDRHFYRQNGNPKPTTLSFSFSSLKEMKELSTWSKNEKLYFIEQLLRTEFTGFDFTTKNAWSNYHYSSLVPIQDELTSVLEGK
jgi:hypothetical protein